MNKFKLNKGALALLSASGLCLVGFDIVGIAVAGFGVFTGSVEIK